MLNASCWKNFIPVLRWSHEYDVISESYCNFSHKTDVIIGIQSSSTPPTAATLGCSLLSLLCLVASSQAVAVAVIVQKESVGRLYHSTSDTEPPPNTSAHQQTTRCTDRIVGHNNTCSHHCLYRVPPIASHATPHVYPLLHRNRHHSD